MKKNNTLALVEAALMIAMSTVLGMLKIYELPNGGSITCASMVPLVLLSYRRGIKWGLAAAFTESLLQMLLKFNVPPTNDFLSFLAVIMLDYVIAYTVLGAAALFGKPFKNRVVSVAVGAVAVTVLRFLCSFLSGVLIWWPYTPEGMSVAFYSFTYNGSYMLPEIIITAVVSVLLVKVLDRVLPTEPAKARS